ncbi:MAG TPA: TIGR01777 family oxidoreductase [Thermoanaerobaculia bacterium]|nr:TIGR01777 family oxidoreductase [Thermoanaerobaculia bacterium]
MRVVVSGGSGFIGQALVRHLIQQGHDTAVLTRHPDKVNLGRPLLWDAKSQGAWSGDAAAADAVINLAGENIGEGRWVAARRRRLIDSRLDATGALVEAMRTQPSRARVFVSASAVGYYGPRGDEELDETASRGEGFLAEMAARWEEEARAADSVSRVVILRFGVVIGPGGGALAKMLLPFRLGLGGRISSGRQWFSWISRDDAARVIDWAMTNEGAAGVYNATAPGPVRNRELTSALARALHRPAIFPIPAIVMKVLFGQMAEETLLSGQRVVPSRLLANGFRFERNAIDSALQYALHRR